jgi:serine protease AprX
MAKIDPQVLLQLTESKKNTASINILMTTKADISSFEKLENQDARGHAVMVALQEAATISQTSLKTFLASKNVPFTSYWITNMINVESADIELIHALAERNDVKKISSNHGWKAEGLAWEDKIQPTGSVQTVEWNLLHVNAEKVWAQGFDGTGYSIGNADTGVAFAHEALIKAYKGNHGDRIDHNYAWNDGVKERHFTQTNRCGYNSTVPCDDNGHGTHTTGTSVGSTATNVIGIAKGAKWQGCRVMEGGFARDKTIIDCLQWFLAPTDLSGRNPKPELRPVAIGNSYGCNPQRCPDSEVQKDAVEALWAAGVFMVVSAGNSGPGCSTVDRAPTHYEKSWVVGATGFNVSAITGFSSRGPVRVDQSNRRKPDVTAPGERVRSSTPPNGYAAYSGTSMSSPLVNGAIAVLYQAVPKIARKMKCVQHIFEHTARHQPSTLCGSTQQSPNNVFGYGTIDMEAAVKYAKTYNCRE